MIELTNKWLLLLCEACEEEWREKERKAPPENGREEKRGLRKGIGVFLRFCPLLITRFSFFNLWNCSRVYAGESFLWLLGLLLKKIECFLFNPNPNTIFFLRKSKSNNCKVENSINIKVDDNQKLMVV